MTVYTNDPLRVKITLQDIWNSFHPSKGIDACFYPSQDQKDEFYCKLSCCDTSPNSPDEEKYKEDLERELYKLNIIQDHIREREPHSHFNSNKSRIVETILDTKTFEKQNRYDVLIDKAKDVHRLSDGRLFGVIVNE